MGKKSFEIIAQGSKKRGRSPTKDVFITPTRAPQLTPRQIRVPLLDLFFQPPLVCPDLRFEGI